MISNIPIYRAKKIDSDEYVVGQYLGYKGYPTIFNEYGLDGVNIDETTLSIHFPSMLDSQGNKIFASLREDGKGGDIVEGKCRDVNGDTITRLHKPLPYKGLVRFYKETLMSVVIETKDEIIEETKGWSTPIYVNIGEALRWCDCRQDIKVVGIKE